MALGQESREFRRVSLGPPLKLPEEGGELRRDGFEPGIQKMHLRGGRHVLDVGQNAHTYKTPGRTFSDIRFDTSAESALREPTKYIRIKVIARVMHCWNRNR